MTGDINNAGWYYKDIAKNAKSSLTFNNAQGEKEIKPGQTLVIFGNGDNAFGDDGGRTPHRFHIIWIQVFHCSIMKIVKDGISMTQPVYHIIEYMMTNQPL